MKDEGTAGGGPWDYKRPPTTAGDKYPYNLPHEPPSIEHKTSKKTVFIIMLFGRPVRGTGGIM